MADNSANIDAEVDTETNSRFAERYRCGPMMRWRQGPGRELVHFQLAGVSRGISSLMASALDTWTAFFTADEAAARITQAVPALPPAEVASTIQVLIESGCLVARSRIIAGAAHPDSSTSDDGVAWLAVPTADRASSLNRALGSYLENANKSGLRCGILIADDSRDASHHAASLEMLSTLEADPAPYVWYCGPDDKVAFAKNLAQKGDIPPEAIHFGLFGSGGSALATGANRNAILLQTLGSMLLSVDDDTVCDARLAPGTEGGLAMADHFDPAEVWCFSARPEALSFGASAQFDVVGEHEKYLGRPVREIMRRESRWGDAPMCVHLLSSLASGDAQIRVTYNGARGDSGLHSDLGQVASRSSATRRRVQDLGDSYRAALDSRQIVRQTACLTLSHVDSPAIGMFMGMDNRAPLPPFMPNCRNEDGIFASVLARMSDHCYSAHLPFTLAHDPPGPRFYPPDRDAAAHFGPDRLLPHDVAARARRRRSTAPDECNGPSSLPARRPASRGFRRGRKCPDVLARLFDDRADGGSVG